MAKWLGRGDTVAKARPADPGACSMKGSEKEGVVRGERAESLDLRRSRTSPFHGAVPDHTMCGRALCAARARSPLGDLEQLRDPYRSEERRVGKECVSTCRYRLSPEH